MVGHMWDKRRAKVGDIWGTIWANVGNILDHILENVKNEGNVEFWTFQANVD